MYGVTFFCVLVGGAGVQGFNFPVWKFGWDLVLKMWLVRERRGKWGELRLFFIAFVEK